MQHIQSRANWKEVLMTLFWIGIACDSSLHVHIVELPNMFLTHATLMMQGRRGEERLGDGVPRRTPEKY